MHSACVHVCVCARVSIQELLNKLLWVLCVIDLDCLSNYSEYSSNVIIYSYAL